MSKVLVSEFYMHGMKKPKRRYAVKGGLIPPFTMTLNGERYIMPGWYKLKPDEETPNIDKNRIYKVLSSKGDKEYLVQMNNTGSMECTCPGYQFRRSCRHIKTVLQP